MKKVFTLGMSIIAVAVLVSVCIPNTSNFTNVASTLPPDLNVVYVNSTLPPDL